MIGKTNIDIDTKVGKVDSKTEIDEIKNKNRMMTIDDLTYNRKKKCNPNWSDSNNGFHKFELLCKDEMREGIAEVGVDCDNPVAPQKKNESVVNRSDSDDTAVRNENEKGGCREDEGTGCDDNHHHP
jgi:hypothetical protein